MVLKVAIIRLFCLLHISKIIPDAMPYPADIHTGITFFSGYDLQITKQCRKLVLEKWFCLTTKNKFSLKRIMALKIF